MRDGQMPDPCRTKPDSKGMILHARIELGGNGLDGRRSDRDRVQRMRRAQLRLSVGSILKVRRHSYRSASAGSTLAAADEGYKVASRETPIDIAATITPCITRGAKGSVSIEYTSADRWMK